MTNPLNQLTPDAARNAEAGPETDRLVHIVKGASAEKTMPVARFEDCSDCLQYSRTPEGAYRAREWLRERVDRAVVVYSSDDPCAGLAGYGGPNPAVYAPTEHLATARLLLLLAAEGVLEVES